MSSTIQRTHKLGKQLAKTEWETPIPGPIHLATVSRPDLKRDVRYLSVGHRTDGSHSPPPLWDPQWLSFSSDRGCVVTGFEEIDGRRYYQGWYIAW